MDAHSRRDLLKAALAGAAACVGSRALTGDAAGKYADLAVLSHDYLTVPEQAIRRIESVLTLLGGKIVHAAAPFV